MKQETLASVMVVSQQAISNQEHSEHVDDDRLEEVSKALDVSAEAIKNFNQGTALSIISNTFNDNAESNGVLYQPTFNPLDKIIELYEGKIALYERMLKEKEILIDKLLSK